MIHGASARPGSAEMMRASEKLCFWRAIIFVVGIASWSRGLCHQRVYCRACHHATYSRNGDGNVDIAFKTFHSNTISTTWAMGSMSERAASFYGNVLVDRDWLVECAGLLETF